MLILNIIRGICMAFADSVPGVSGGTVAFVMGFYSDFIQSINALTSKSSNTEKKNALNFLFKLGIGWIGGFILSVLCIASLFETHIYNISSLFLGFIIFSLPIIYKEEKEIVSKHLNHFVYSIIGFLVVVLITYFNPTSQDAGISMSINHFSVGMGVYVFIAGMIAISAMVLPGISGSTLLLIFGLYAPIITGIKTLLGLDFSPLPLLICFGLGVIVGIFSTVRIIGKLLITKRSQLIYLIFGLMIGSLYAVIMGPTTLEIPQAPMSFSNFSIIFFFLGGAIIWGLEKFKTVLQK
ncbi:MAG: DUF368 domain-containing protein [Cellulosilyticum sp.]|nr:DUF368 domain-containing protein [Cellulosilyticum sp.]MEE1073614.1 DUF368 domain-containing protein [Cellulosilyticum sp.]